MEKLTAILPILRKVKGELLLLLLSLLTTAYTIHTQVSASQVERDPEDIEIVNTAEHNNGEGSAVIYVDVSGAVEKPNMYALPTNARLKDAVEKAGGLSVMADYKFFGRNFNLSQVLSDQSKIHIPTIDEISEGIYQEGIKRIETLSTNSISVKPQTKKSAVKISINYATLEELDSLPNIGRVTAQKIIDTRPHLSIEDLKTKKVVKTNVYDSIKDIIDL